MSYNYETEKPEIFTEGGQEMFLSIRDEVKRLLNISGAFQMQMAIKGQAGNAWTMMACVDRLVELGEIKQVTNPNKVAGQHQVYVANR